MAIEKAIFTLFLNENQNELKIKNALKLQTDSDLIKTILIKANKMGKL